MYGSANYGASGKESAYQCRRLKRCGFDPWLRKIPWRRRAWLPLHYSCLENPIDSPYDYDPGVL